MVRRGRAGRRGRGPIEDPIDRVVFGLNNIIGQHWVNVALDYVQSQMETSDARGNGIRKLNAVYCAERNYGGQPGAIKKQTAMKALQA